MYESVQTINYSNGNDSDENLSHDINRLVITTPNISSEIYFR